VYPHLAGYVPAYPLFLFLGIVAAALAGAWGLHRHGGLARGDCLRVQATLALAGLLGGKLYSLIERGGSASLHAEMTQGFRYPGALLGVIATLLLLRWWWRPRVSLAALADALAPSVAVGAALVRLGCLAYGCCSGSPTHLPWAVRFPAHSPVWNAHIAAGWIGPRAEASLPVHPLQLYFILLSLAAGGLALWLQKRKACAGEVALAFLAADGLGKWALEALRHDPLPATRLASLLLAMAAVTLLTLLPAARPRRTPEVVRLSRPPQRMRARSRA
jgi:phosphatidylglycerol:prolipoprotein diacylglycerol transferase